jgi:hypothetical protein
MLYSLARTCKLPLRGYRNLSEVTCAYEAISFYLVPSLLYTSVNAPRTLCPNRCQYFRRSFRVALRTLTAQCELAH